MSDPTSRALRLLSLLQTHRFWAGPELAGRLGVSERTLRRDVDRLRELGYRVGAHPGVSGGYQLESGSTVPPLLLNDDEAVTIAVGLRTAALSGVGDGDQTSLSALAKIEQVLPRNLRRRVSALQEHTVPANRPGIQIDAEVLAQLALACRDHERLRFRYTDRTGRVSGRHVEPHSLVPRGRYWYFLAWDVDRADWRTFRIDRLARVLATGVRVPARELPAKDAAEFVQQAHGGGAQHRVEAVVRMRASLEQVRAHFGPWASKATEGPAGTVDWPIWGSTVTEVVAALVWVPAEIEWELVGPEEVTEAARAFAERVRVAVTPPG